MNAESDGVRALAQLCSLGLTSARMLAEAGVPDPEALRRLGALQAYRRLRFHFGKLASASYLYALECALTCRDWRDLKDERMAELKIEAKKIADELEAMSRKS